MSSRHEIPIDNHGNLSSCFDPKIHCEAIIAARHREITRVPNRAYYRSGETNIPEIEAETARPAMCLPLKPAMENSWLLPRIASAAARAATYRNRLREGDCYDGSRYLTA